jgi:hypothetical protein
LLEVVGALRSPGGLTRRLHRRQQQSYQHADDGNDHQEFNERKCGGVSVGFHVSLLLPT